MSARLPFPLPDPSPGETQPRPDNTTSGTTPPSVKLTEEELDLLMEFFAILREWDRKKKVA